MCHEMSTATERRFRRVSRSEHQQPPAPRSSTRSEGFGSSASIAAAKSCSRRALSTSVSAPFGENGFTRSHSDEPVRPRYSFSACFVFTVAHPRLVFESLSNLRRTIWYPPGVQLETRDLEPFVRRSQAPRFPAAVDRAAPLVDRLVHAERGHPVACLVAGS